MSLWLVVLNGILFGLGLAMDAFSVSLANGLNEPHMRLRKMCGIASVFAIFQGVMPMLGWVCVHSFVTYFTAVAPFIPWVSLVLLCFIGGKMIYDGCHCEGESCPLTTLTLGALLLQGIATSIDALSVGFSIAEYRGLEATVCAALIALVTFPICLGGLLLGRTFGMRFAKKAHLFGGIILILIGVEICLTGVLGG